MKYEMGRCLEITGQLSAAWLLLHLLNQNPTVRREGKLWVARKPDDWRAKTALGVAQLGIAVETLKKYELIHTAGASGGKLHLRLSDYAHELLAVN